MKFKLLLTLLYSTFTIITSTCKNSTEPKVGENDISVVIQNSDIYEYRTGIAGDEEGVIITKQSHYHEISEIIRGKETNFEAVYRYKPKHNFKGTDSVELEKQTGSDGSSPPTRFEKVRIFITVK